MQGNQSDQVTFMDFLYAAYPKCTREFLSKEHAKVPPAREFARWSFNLSPQLLLIPFVILSAVPLRSNNMLAKQLKL